jgi:hypothetical protein
LRIIDGYSTTAMADKGNAERRDNVEDEEDELSEQV